MPDVHRSGDGKCGSGNTESSASKNKTVDNEAFHDTPMSANQKPTDDAGVSSKTNPAIVQLKPSVIPVIACGVIDVANTHDFVQA